MEEDIIILDNFLPVEEFNKLEELLFSYGFPWFFMDSIGTPQDTNRFFMCHGFMGGPAPLLPILRYLNLSYLNSLALINYYVLRPTYTTPPPKWKCMLCTWITLSPIKEPYYS